MAFISDTGLDQAVSWIITNGTRIDICSQEPTTYAEATSTYTLGNSTVTLTGPADGDTDGRAATVPALTGKAVTADGTATHFAITDGSSVLVATGTLSSSVAVTTSGLWSTSAHKITVRDATDV